MIFTRRTREAHRDGFKQGLWTAFIVASPLIVAGVKWLTENADPVAKRMRNIKNSDLYTQFFNKDVHQEKQATKKLQNFRAGEGMFGNYDVEASDAEDEELFHMIKEITKNEMKNEE